MRAATQSWTRVVRTAPGLFPNARVDNQFILEQKRTIRFSFGRTF